MHLLRQIPAVHQIQKDVRFTEIIHQYAVSETMLTEWASIEIDALRSHLLQNNHKPSSQTRDQLIDRIFQQLQQRVVNFHQNNLQPVINATGTVLHTNLGRARLSEDAIQHITNTAASYSTLEYDITTGARGSRHDIVEDYLQHITGAEAAMVVNNNAAAVYLVLKALASNKEVIVSRGELVEIGGSFRISTIMEESGAILKEIGTTNKTYATDYEQAITEETALLMKVHRSNFNMTGFTHEVSTEALVKLAREVSIPIYEDLGSGTLHDFKSHQIGNEPTVKEKIQAGIDIVSFSGDKLLGGPQAGIIVGKKKHIEALKKHQLARVLRVDKFTLAGLEATLKSYIRNQAAHEVPTVRDIIAPKTAIQKKVAHFVARMNQQSSKFACTIQNDFSKVGGGTMPEVEVETVVVHLAHQDYTTTQLDKKLRTLNKPIIARVKHDTIVLDFRTVNEEELEDMMEELLSEV